MARHNNNRSYKFKLDNFEAELLENQEHYPNRNNILNYVARNVEFRSAEQQFNTERDCEVFDEPRLYADLMEAVQGLWYYDLFRGWFPTVYSGNQFMVLETQNQSVKVSQGVFGVVLLGIDKGNNCLVALKLFRKYAGCNLKSMLIEIGMATKAHYYLHQKSVKYLALLKLRNDSYWARDYQQYVSVCEFCAVIPGIPVAVTVQDAIMKYPTRMISRTQWRDIFSMLIEITYILYQVNIFHLDLKPDNIILCFNQDQLHPVVIDFGLARDEKPYPGPVFRHRGKGANYFRFIDPWLFHNNYPIWCSDLYAVIATIGHVITQLKLSYTAKQLCVNFCKLPHNLRWRHFELIRRLQEALTPIVPDVTPLMSIPVHPVQNPPPNNAWVNNVPPNLRNNFVPFYANCLPPPRIAPAFVRPRLPQNSVTGNVANRPPFNLPAVNSRDPQSIMLANLTPQPSQGAASYMQASAASGQLTPYNRQPTLPSSQEPSNYVQPALPPGQEPSNFLPRNSTPVQGSANNLLQNFVPDEGFSYHPPLMSPPSPSPILANYLQQNSRKVQKRN